MSNKYSETDYEIFTLFDSFRGEDLSFLKNGYRKSFYDNVSMEIVPYDKEPSSTVRVGLIRGNYLPIADPITKNAVSVDHFLENFYLPSIPELLGFSTQYLADPRKSLQDLFFKVTVSTYYSGEFEKRIYYACDQIFQEFDHIFSKNSSNLNLINEYSIIREHIIRTLDDLKLNVQLAQKLFGGRFVMRLRSLPEIRFIPINDTTIE